MHSDRHKDVKCCTMNAQLQLTSIDLQVILGDSLPLRQRPCLKKPRLKPILLLPPSDRNSHFN